MLQSTRETPGSLQLSIIDHSLDCSLDCTEDITGASSWEAEHGLGEAAHWLHKAQPCRTFKCGDPSSCHRPIAHGPARLSEHANPSHPSFMLC